MSMLRLVAGRRFPQYSGSTSLPPTSTRMVGTRLTTWLMITPALLGLIIFFAYPLVANAYYSFTRYDLLQPPQWVGLRNYRYLFTQDPRVGRAALNTIWLVVIMVPAKIIGALAIATLLSRVKRAAAFWRTVFYLPALIPPVASIVAFVFLFNPGTGPVNAVLKAIGIRGPLWFNDPALAKPSLVLLSMWAMGDIMIILLASLLDVPVEQREAALLDGASTVQRFRFVTIPHLRPVLTFAVVVGVIHALQYFTEAAVASSVASGRSGVTFDLNQILGYPGDSLLTYTEWLYVRGFTNFQLGYAASLAVVLFVVTAAFLLVLLRRFDDFHPARRP